MLTKEQKKNYISEMTTQFENSKAVMVTHYQGLTMTQLDELRAKMREHGIIFKVTKNRITKIAIEKTKCKDLSNLFTGPTAVAFGEDAIMSARILSKFSKDNESLKLIEHAAPTCCCDGGQKNRFRHHYEIEHFGVPFWNWEWRRRNACPKHNPGDFDKDGNSSGSSYSSKNYQESSQASNSTSNNSSSNSGYSY